MRQQIQAGLQDWVSKKLAENARRPVSPPGSPSKPWWQRVGMWVQQKVQPVRQVVSRPAASQARVAAPSRGNPPEWQAAQRAYLSQRAYQDYRAGERQAYAQPSTVAPSQPKSAVPTSGTHNFLRKPKPAKPQEGEAAQRAYQDYRAGERQAYAGQDKDQPLDSATRSYMAWAKAVEQGKFDTQAYAKGVQAASQSMSSPTPTRSVTLTPTATPIATSTPTGTPLPPYPPTRNATPTASKTPTATTMLQALNMNRDNWLEYHQHQGDGTNDCGPTNLAMVLSAFSGQPRRFDKDTIGNRMYTQWQRIPQHIFGVPIDPGGATFPWSMASQFNQIAAAENIPWRATWQAKGSQEQLLDELQQGHPVTILRIWDNGGAHYQTVIGYNHDDGRFVIIDPAYDAPKTSPQTAKDARIVEQTGAELKEDWSRQTWWSQLIGIQNGMIIYHPVLTTGGTPVATPTPTAPAASTPAPSTPTPPVSSMTSTPTLSTPAPDSTDGGTR